MKTNLDFEQKTKIFMELMNNKEALKSSDALKFSDIDPNIESDTKIYSWFYQQSYKNLEAFLKECQKYKNIYPIAYQKIVSKLEKKQNSLSRIKKIELLLSYIENHNIPTGRSTIRFCDIDKNIKDTTVVGIFIQSNLEYKEMLFLSECTKYKEIYPIAYQKIKAKIEKRHTLNIQKERVRMYMKYINNPQAVPIKTKIRFCDIDKSCIDTVQVESWIRSQLSLNLDWIKKEYRKYKEIYQEAYCKMNSRIIALENKRMVIPLTFTKRVEMIMRYLEKKEISKIEKTLAFKDICSETNDVTLVRTWLINQLSVNSQSLIKEAGKYKKLYSIGYQKLLLRRDACIKESNKVSNYLSFEKKTELLMAYLEYNLDLNKKKDLKFSDLDSNIKDESNIKNWFTKNLSRNLPNFIEEYSKYKEKYPCAYQKVTDIINNSQVRIAKSRLLLLEQLKYLRNSLIKEEYSPKIKIYKK